ncbi:hypothetical protein [Streptomyces bauhiniae]|uniref:Uncharacterized protein n=1 Tax=Streptomyces bauhiniae TaxID=2340725 RepID=A0A7K3QRC3_9ACTN|nr:hypothetical protein [Streptomyces bauhiniae]NEB92448.1 hypothetical protein [Streptomyces bauhiniae]
MATLNIQALAITGTNPTFTAAAAGGDKVSPSGDRTYIHVKNGSASSVNVTITSYGVGPRGAATADRVIAVPASQERMIPVYSDLNANPVDGLASIAYSAVATVTVGAFRN